MSQILQEGQVIELAGNADHQLAYEALSQLAAGGQAGPGHTIVIQGRNYNFANCWLIFPKVIRAIPFEKLVGGVSGVSFSDHPAAIFHFFLGYPAVIFFPLTQC